MSGGYREMEVWCCLYCRCSHEWCDGCLCVGELIFSDFFTDCDHDTLPSNHCSETEWYRDHDDYPIRYCFSSTDDTRDIIHCWKKCDEDKHSKSYSLLSIVWSMCKTDKCTWCDESSFDPSFWILIPESSRMLKKIMILHIQVEDMHRTKCEKKAKNRWHKKGFHDFNRFLDGENNTCIHPVHHEWHTEDWSDQCVWTRCRKSHIPCTEVPDDSRDEERKHDTDTKFHTWIGNFFKRKELHDTDSNSGSSYYNSEKVKKCRQKDCLLGGERIGVDNWCNRIGCIVESVNKLERTDKEEAESCKDICKFHKIEVKK